MKLFLVLLIIDAVFMVAVWRKTETDNRDGSALAVVARFWALVLCVIVDLLIWGIVAAAHRWL